MNRIRFVLFLLGIVVGLAGLSPAAPDKAFRDKVAMLVQQLSDPKTQVAAETDLIKMGPDVLPLLPTDGKLTPAQKERLQTIRKTLREAQVLKDLEPKTVTLKADGMPLAQVLKKLHEQTGIDVQDRRQFADDDAKLKLNLNKSTFWQALDAIAQQADLAIGLYEKDGKVSLHDGPYRAVPVSYSGLFRIAVKRISATKDLETDQHTCTIHLEVAWEPRFRPLFMENKTDSLVVQDDKGIALKVPDMGGGRVALTQRNTANAELVIEAPKRNIAKLGLLKGQFNVIGPGRMLTFGFDQVKKVDKNTKPENWPTKTIDGIHVKIREFTTEPDLWSFNLLLEYPEDGPDFESFESWVVNNEIYLVDKKGNRHKSNGGYEVDEQRGHRAVVTYHFVDEGDLKLGKPENWKVEYSTPGMMAKVPIQFEFKDLPLP